ncbi:transporter substrate-binding domain-containing protein [Sulfitobacter aestuariivivens]|uniref:Transporter substrate-binding domain-containing protein n=1 Tax=Sulfitobacter aestuariivivens TaxID=2766981 RepID=A0A927D9S0_9RHOB|nr:transporter substrate-binding domain-containing protein [Sulfitobacter aestuariivivens]MBD3666272.1 transporter substrate-binding domain-containing protein [Sulfitobacter aestuariivivens]
MSDDLHSLANDGILRAAINTGNRALVQREGDHLSGVSPALALRFAQEIGADLHPVIYDGAGKVFADAHGDVWDVAFLAVDAMRAEKVAFTRPYHTIEATFAVRASSALQNVEQVDRPGVRVLTSTGSAYDMHLTKTLQHASLERSGTPPASFAEFRAGRCDAVAGVRASLEGFFGDDRDVRILSGVLTAVHQAMVLPRNDDPRISALDDFVARAVSDGFVAAHL